jgi:cytoskeletal protein CcmA (bactofilin family)
MSIFGRRKKDRIEQESPHALRHPSEHRHHHDEAAAVAVIPAEQPRAAPKAREQDQPMPTVIGNAADMRGDVKTEGDVLAVGKFDGNVDCRTLKVDAGASINGSVRAVVVNLSGRVDGRIEARTLRVYASAVVTGDVHCQEIGIQPGAVFNASITMAASDVQRVTPTRADVQGARPKPLPSPRRQAAKDLMDDEFASGLRERQHGAKGRSRSVSDYVASPKGGETMPFLVEPVLN